MILLPNGELHERTRTPNAETLIDAFSTEYYTDPTRLYEAGEPIVQLGTAIVDPLCPTCIVATPDDGVTGRLAVVVRADDGLESVGGFYTFTVTDALPELPPDRTVSFTEDNVVLDLLATDGDGEDVDYTFDAMLYEESSYRAYDLDQRLDLRADETYYENWYGANGYPASEEKWLLGNEGWVVLLPNGELHRATPRPGAETLIATLGEEYYLDPALLHDAADPVVVGTVSSGDEDCPSCLVVDPADGFVGSAIVRMTAADEHNVVEGTVRVTFANLPPELDLPGLAMSHLDGTIEVDLPATDADGEPVSYEVASPVTDRAARLAFEANGELDLRPGESYYHDWYGRNGYESLGEKWIRGTGGWFIVLPNGELHRATPTPDASTLVAVLSPAHHADPAMIHEAETPAVVGTARIEAGRLVVDTDPSYAGTLVVDIELFDGVNVVIASVDVEVVNLAPEIDLPTTTVSHAEDTVTIVLPATDPEGEAVQYVAGRVVDRHADAAYRLDQSLGLRFGGSYYADWYGANGGDSLGEKWIRSDDGWLILLPDGQLHRATPTPDADSLVERLTPDFFDDPTLLHDAEAPTPVGTSRVVNGNELVVDPFDGYVGSLVAKVTGKDGVNSVTAGVDVDVVNHAPVLDTADRVVVAGGRLVIALPGVDLDGDAVTYQSDGVHEEEAYRVLRLDRDLELRFAGSYHQNWYAQFTFGGTVLREKWIRSATGWMIILPDGELHRATTEPDDESLIAALDPAYYLDPARLHDASEPPSAGSAQIVGGQLVVDFDAAFTGSAVVVVSAFDGIETTRHEIRVTVG